MLTPRQPSRRRSEATSYDVRVPQHLDAQMGARLIALTLTRNSDGTATLCGAVPGWAALHDLLPKVRPGPSRQRRTIMTIAIRPVCTAHTEPSAVFGTCAGFWLARALELTGSPPLPSGATASSS